MNRFMSGNFKRTISSTGNFKSFLQSKMQSIFVASCLNPELIDLTTFAAHRSRLFGLQPAYLSPEELNYALPAGHVPEFAFIGRSNVGKSSLINALIKSKLVRVSKEPGCTRSLNFYSFQKKERKDILYFVDMPGYGFAKVSKADKSKWRSMIDSYLKSRDQSILRRVYILIDSRHGLKASDKDMLAILDDYRLPYQVILTKADAATQIEKSQSLESVFDEVMKPGRQTSCLPLVHLVSARTGEGMGDLELAMAEIHAQKWTVSGAVDLVDDAETVTVDHEPSQFSTHRDLT